MLNLRDLRYAARNLARTPTLLAIATLSLGLGAGVNTALYSAFRAVLQRAPSAHAPDRLVRLEPGNGNQMAIPNLRDLVAGQAIEGLAAYAVTRLNLRSGSDVEQVLAIAVSPDYFAVLGLRPSIGRPIGDAEDGSVVITHRFWRRRLAALQDPVGAVVTLNGRPFVVGGVLPSDHRAITGAVVPDFYVPITEALTPKWTDRRHAFVTVIGRLRSGASIEQARNVLKPQLQALERLYPDTNAGLADAIFIFPAVGLASWQTRDVRATALAGIAAVPFALFGLVLLTACANVAGLLLARGAARRREIAIRLALGASRAQVMGTLLAESLLLALLGSMVGFLVAWGAGRVGSATLSSPATGPIEIAPDATALVYSLCLAAVVTIACGALPALASTRPQVTDAMRPGRTVGHTPASRRVLVGAQVGAATLLLFLSLLVLRSVGAMRDAAPGFLIDDVATATVQPEPTRYADDQRLRFAAEAVDAVRALPGVTSAGLASMVPLSGDVVSRTYGVGAAARREAYVMHVGPDYFRTMGVGLRRGRAFTNADRRGGADVAIVNRAFAATHGIEGNPLTVRISGGGDQPPLEIVGVVDDTKYAFFGEAPHPIVYRPFLQAGGRIVIVARGPAGPAALVPAMKRALTGLDPGALVEVRTMREATSFEGSMRAAGWRILGGLGALGLALALIGLYGLMSYTVVQQTRDLGIRMALGASRGQVQGFVLRTAVVLVGIGVATGTAAAVLLARPIAFALSGTSPVDPVALAATVASVFATGLAASYVPARRATRVDPMAALRAE